MAAETKQAHSATTALIYLTLGALMDVWTAIYYIYLSRHGGSDIQYLWCHGFLFSGLVLIGIGLAVGRIGRHARQAEVEHPPSQPTPPPANFVGQPVAVVPQVPATPPPVVAMPPSRQTTRA